MSLGHVLISSVRDEGPYVLEWVAHHRVLGFDLICIASNDCRDGTDVLLAALDRGGAIRHAANQVPRGEMPQHSGYVLLRERFGLDRADWLMVLDADEFLVVHAGQGRVQDLTGTAPAQVDVISLCAATFGTDPGPWAPGRVCDRFRLRLPLAHKANAMIKSITRGPGRFVHIHNHSMVGFRSPQDLQVMRADGSVFSVAPGVALWKRLRNFPAAEICHDLAQFNHYAVKTRDSYDLRKSRALGTARDLGEANLRHTEAYFDTITAAGQPDTAILRYAGLVEAEMDRLRALPGVAEAQARAEAAYAALIRV